jgi:hypothetical protein
MALPIFTRVGFEGPSNWDKERSVIDPARDIPAIAAWMLGVTGTLFMVPW